MLQNGLSLGYHRFGEFKTVVVLNLSLSYCKSGRTLWNLHLSLAQYCLMDIKPALSVSRSYILVLL